MSVVGDQALTVARSWIGTPYQHQMTMQGAGCDCLGLLRGIWREIYGREPELPPAYTMDWSEPQGDEQLWRAAHRHLLTKSLRHEDPGDVLLFRMKTGAVAKHLGIQANVGANVSFVHAYSHHGVVESPLSAPWQRRVVARFEFPKESNQWQQ